MARRNTGISLLPQVIEDLDQLARTDDQGRTRNQLIEEACRQFIPRERARRRKLGEFGGRNGGRGDYTRLETGDMTFSGPKS